MSLVKKKEIVYISICSFLVLLVIYFTSNIIIGKRGLITLFALRDNLNYYDAILKDSLLTRELLENKNNLLRKDNPDIDLLDEQVRRILGYVDPEEFVILTDPQS